MQAAHLNKFDFFKKEPNNKKINRILFSYILIFVGLTTLILLPPKGVQSVRTIDVVNSQTEKAYPHNDNKYLNAINDDVALSTDQLYFLIKSIEVTNILYIKEGEQSFDRLKFLETEIKKEYKKDLFIEHDGQIKSAFIINKVDEKISFSLSDSEMKVSITGLSLTDADMLLKKLKDNFEIEMKLDNQTIKLNLYKEQSFYK